ncbi:MAG: NAD(P)H-dependent oxidoreductase subunit E [Peptococcaceae bacterium]|nr:NAD(P)H-dependent oxidoreductase subunit E [Peptococcaceae bacterium]
MKSLTLEFCVGTACHMKGTPDIIAAVEALPPEIRSNILLRLTHCLGNCGAGPNVKFDGILHSRVTVDSLSNLLKRYFQQE